MYPLGIIGEVRAIEYFSTKGNISNEYYLFSLRTLQIVIVASMIALYVYMLEQRKKYFKRSIQILKKTN